MKRNLFSFMLALLAVGAMLVTGCKKYDDDISDLNKRIGDLETSASSLDQAVKTAQTAAVAAQSAADAAGAAAVAAGAAVVTVGEAAEKAQGTADQAILDAAAAEAEAVAAQATADQALALATAAATRTEVEMYAKMAKEAHSFLDSLINDNEKAIEANLARIVSLNAGLNGALKRIATLENNVTALENTVKTHGDQIEALFAKVTADSTALGKALADVKADLEQLAGDNADAHQKFEDAIKDLNDGLTQTNAQLVSVEAALTAKIETLSATVEGLIKDVLDTISVERTRIDSLYTTTETLWYAISFLDTTQKGDFKKCMEQVTKNKADIQALNDKVAGLQASLNQVTKDLAAEVIRAEQAESDIREAYQAADKQLKDEIKESLEATEKKLEDQIKAVNDALEAYKEEVEGKLSALKAELEGEIATLKSDVAANAAAISGLKDAVEQLKQTDIALGSRIEALEQAIEGKLIIVTEYAGKMLTSVTIIPDAFYQGIPCVVYGSLDYKALSSYSKGTFDEKWVASGATTSTAMDAVATFRLNPSKTGLTDNDITVEALKPTDVTILKSSSQAKVLVTEWTIKENTLTVPLKIIGTTADGDNVTIFQLAVTTKKSSTDSARTIITDYVALKKSVTSGFKLGFNNGTKNLLLRRGTTGIGKAESTAASKDSVKINHAPWDSLTYPNNNRDTLVDWAVPTAGGNFDFSNNVRVMVPDATRPDGYRSPEGFEAASGYKITYELVDNFKVQGVKQADGFKLDSCVLSGTDVDGKAPIVRISLINKNKDVPENQNVVDVAYARVFFPTKSGYSLSLDEQFNSLSTSTQTRTASIEPVAIQMGMTPEQFAERFSVESIAGSFGNDVAIDADGIVSWTADAGDIWDNRGDDVSVNVTFSDSERNHIYVSLTGSVYNFTDEFQIKSCVDLYWDNNICYMNVAPHNKNYEPNNCEYSYPLADFFQTNAAGIVFDRTDKGTPTAGGGIYDVDFVFDKQLFDSLELKIDDRKILASVADDGHTLKIYKEYESLDKYDFAYITGTPGAQEIIINKGSYLAQQLLNENMASEKKDPKTQRAYAAACLKATASLKFNGLANGYEVTVRFPKQNPSAGNNYSFEAKFIRPVQVEFNSGVIDGLKDGTATSYLKVDRIISNIWEWDGTDFSPKEYAAGNDVWKYYGRATGGGNGWIAYCDVTYAKYNTTTSDPQASGWESLPPSMLFNYDPTGALSKSKLGEFTYSNSQGGLMTTFYIKVPVIIEYGWGSLTKEVVLKVEQ